MSVVATVMSQGAIEGTEASTPDGVGVLPDAELIRRARCGELGAQDALFRRFREPAFLLALQLLGNREDALDVAQDSMMRFLQNLDRFDTDRPVLPWLRRIVRNRTIDLRRRRRVRKAGSLDTGGPEGQPIEVPDRTADSGAAVADNERRRIVWRCLAALNPAQREILVLRDYQDLTYQEIADVLEVPIGTVMSRLHRARAELRRQVLEEVGELLPP